MTAIKFEEEIFKVTGDQRMLENALPHEWMDGSNQTCIGISFRDAKDLIRFW